MLQPSALQSAVLTFSDLQVLLGISILVSGHSQLHCGLAVYHWQLIVDLAWFSSITHLTTLTSLRGYFQERPALRLGRMVCMVVIAVMLSAALGSTGHGAPASFPACCLLHPPTMTQGLEEAPAYGLVEDNAAYIAIALAFSDGQLSHSNYTAVPKSHGHGTNDLSHPSKQRLKEVPFPIKGSSLMPLWPMGQDSEHSRVSVFAINKLSS